jgi:hypothetical protein
MASNVLEGRRIAFLVGRVTRSREISRLSLCVASEASMRSLAANLSGSWPRPANRSAVKPPTNAVASAAYGAIG